MPASQDLLGKLHDAVTIVMLSQIQAKAPDFDEDGVQTGEYYTATPAQITAAIKFLKDNDITCDIEESEGLSDIQEELNKRKKLGRRTGKIQNISHLLPDEALHG